MSNLSIQFHEPVIEDLSDSNILYPEYQFGIIQVEIASTPMLEVPQLVHFTNDMSGSMSDTCNDDRTKMQHLIHTKKNILNVLANNSETTDILVQSYGFDNKIEEVFPATKVVKENILQLNSSIDTTLIARGLTDISLALEHSQEKLQLPEFQNRFKSHIFMTDGNITVGDTELDILSSYIDSKNTNFFIGYGEGHDAKLLQSLAKKMNGSYYFVDAIENSGYIFGEILHSILFATLRDTIITVENGEIYNYNTNTWSSTLTVGTLTSEATKTFHIRSNDPEKVKVTMTAHNAANLQESASASFTREVSCEDTKPRMSDLTKYILRQKTLELLFISTNLNMAEMELIKNAKRDISDFKKVLKKYIEFYHLEEDEFCQTLLTDIKIARRTLGTTRAQMYCGARGDSQGRERSYNVTLPTHNKYSASLSPPILNRTNTTPSQMIVMRSVSASIDEDGDEDKTEDIINTIIEDDAENDNTDSTKNSNSNSDSDSDKDTIIEEPHYLHSFIPRLLSLPSTVKQAFI